MLEIIGISFFLFLLFSSTGCFCLLSSLGTELGKARSTAVETGRAGRMHRTVVGKAVFSRNGWLMAGESIHWRLTRLELLRLLWVEEASCRLVNKMVNDVGGTQAG